MGINKELLYSDAKQDNAMRLVCEKQKGNKRIEMHASLFTYGQPLKLPF